MFALDEMCSSAVPSVLVFFCEVAAVGVGESTRETSRDRQRRHPSRRGLAQTERLRAGCRYYPWSYCGRG